MGMSRRQFLALLRTDRTRVSYIPQTGETFKVKPTASFLTPEQRFGVLLGDNPSLSNESVDYLIAVFEGRGG